MALDNTPSQENSYRNPSAPPSPASHQLEGAESPTGVASVTEDLEASDRIGDSVFSKAWLLSLLVKTLNCVSAQKDSPFEDEGNLCGAKDEQLPRMDFGGNDEGTFCETDGNGDLPLASADGNFDELSEASMDRTGNGSILKTEEDKEGVEMDPSLEEDLCLLWDASMNSDVVEYLHGNQSADLLLGVAARTNLLRLKEVSIGIVGNMASVSSPCRHSLSTQSSMDSIMVFLESEDSRVLIETTRLISSCLSCPETRTLWLEFVRDRASDSLLQCLTFILRSSTNDDLLRNAASLLDSVLDGSEEVLKAWCGETLVEAMCEAVQQTSVSAEDVSGSLILSLQLFSTIDKGVAVLGSLSPKVVKLSLNFLQTLDHISPSNCSTALAAASLLDIITKHTRQKLTVDKKQSNTLLRLVAEVGRIEDCEQYPVSLKELTQILSLLLEF